MSETNLVKRIVKAIETKYPTSWVVKISGGPYQTSGLPDIFAVIENQFFALEVKKQRAGESETHCRNRATPLQLFTIDKINRAGGSSTVVISVDETLEYIGKQLAA